MNIFATDRCPVECAKNLDSRRVNKMMLETTQLFGYAMNNLSIDEKYYPRKKDGVIYKTGGSHRKHPCTLWLQESRGNFDWLMRHLTGLCEEYEFRYDKECAYRENLVRIQPAREQWPEGRLTEFTNSSMFKEDENVISAYRRTMINKWESAKATQNPRKRVDFGPRQEPYWYDSLKENSDGKETA